MTCDQAELRMADLLLGELPAGERARLERHLLDCASCRADFELARAGARFKWADVPVPAALIESTLASLRETPRAARFFRWATAAAALVGVAILLVSSGRGTRPTPTLTRGPDQLSCASELPAAPPTQTAACGVDRPTVLATVQEPVVGALEARDEDGRPVGELGLTSHNVSVEILDGIAKTTVAEIFENRTDRRLEGTFSFPLPSDASISRLALEVNGKMEEGSCLERERARQVFESIVRRMQDPALLEWQPGGLFKCRIFPIEPRAAKRVLVAYTQTLPCFQGKMRYVYPLASEKTRNHPPGEVRIDVLARFSGGLSAMESTSHHLDVRRKDAREASMAFRATNYRPRNDFVVTLEPAEEEVRVVCHKPEGEDGYFACFATPQAAEPRAPGKYTFVLDASASTSAPRLEVAKRLVRAMMERRIDGDRFEVIAHSIETRSSGEVDLRAANTFMDAIRPIGGSDVLKALRAAGPGEIIYIGRGLPTFGEMDAAKILEAAKGLRIRTVAVGSDANEPLLERLGGLMRITPNDEVDKRVAEIAATLGSAAISELTVEGANVRDVVGGRDVFAGERVVLAGRYTGAGPSKLVVRGRGYRREVDVVFPGHEEGNNPIRRLWAQRKVSDLLAQGGSTQAAVTELGVKYQIMTPYTSFLVLENEQMWKDHQLQREKQKQDEVLGKAMEEEKKRIAEAEAAAHEIATKREVTRKIAHLLELAYMAVDQKRYDRCMKLCDELLIIDPHYAVARELRDDAEKTRHKEEYYSQLAGKVEQWKKLTADDEAAAIPQSQTVRFPSREEWAEISPRLNNAVIRTEGGVAAEVSPEEMEKLARELAQGRSAADQQAIYESQRHYEQALMFNNRGEFDRAKAESQKAVSAWSENLAARKLINDINRITVGGPSVGDPRDDFRVRIEQAQIEIAKHVRDGERYLNARMYDHALREFENAEFKIQNIPYEVKAMNELLPLVKDSIVKSRNARILEEHRTEEEKKRMAEAEAAAHELKSIPGPSQWDQLLTKLQLNSGLDAQTWTEADRRYRLAERYYTAGDFEKAEIECQKALELGSNYAPARALEAEVQFLLGKGKATPSSREYGSFMKQSLVRNDQLLVEMDNALERGRRFRSAGDVESANRESRKILEYSKWMPAGVELEARRKLALDLLQTPAVESGAGFSSQESARLESWDVPKQTFTSAPGAPITDALPLTVDALEFPSMEVWREAVQKRAAEAGTTQGLDLNRLSIDRKLDTMKVDLNFTQTKLEDVLAFVRDFSGLNIILDAGVRDRVDPDRRITYKAADLPVREQLRGILAPFGLDYEVTDENVVLLTDARRVVAHRRPKGIQAMDEDLSAEDQHIKELLRDIRITIDMQGASLTAVVDYIREASGLNIHISGIDNPEQMAISFKAQDMALDGALRLLLEPRNLGHVVRDGVVLITTRDAVARSFSKAAQLRLAGIQRQLSIQWTAMRELSLRIEDTRKRLASARVASEVEELRRETQVLQSQLYQLEQQQLSLRFSGWQLQEEIRAFSRSRGPGSQACQDLDLDVQSLNGLEAIRAKMGMKE